MEQILEAYEADNEAFQKMKLTEPVEFKLGEELKYYVSPEYPVPEVYKERLFDELSRLETEDIIERCNSSFSSPAFIVEKRNKEIRLVVDYRKINDYLIDEIIQIPKIHDSLRLLECKACYCQIDLKNGFNQLELTDKSKRLTGFSILGRHYQYKRVPFGMKSGPKIFQLVVSKMLEELDNCFVYIDDIVVYGNTIEEHDEALERVLKKLYENEVRINFAKSTFKQEEIEVLGCIINKDGIKACLKNLDVEKILVRPTSLKGVQKILGLINWYRNFVPNLSTLIVNITDLLKNPSKRRIEWSEIHDDELRKLIEEIEKNVVLKCPDFSKKFFLETDASDDGLGGVLTQEHGIIGFYSKKFSGAEINYTIVEKELYAIYKSLDFFKELVQGNLVIIKTDSKDCTFINNKVSNRFERWKVLLNEYTFRIEAIEGENNNMADYLSRECCMESISTIENEYTT